MFTFGCFGLPWLWICHVLYWQQQKGLGHPDNAEGGSGSSQNEGLINPDDRT